MHKWVYIHNIHFMNIQPVNTKRLSIVWYLLVEDFKSTIHCVIGRKLKRDKVSTSHYVRMNTSFFLPTENCQVGQFFSFSLSDQYPVTGTAISCCRQANFSHSQFDVVAWLNLNCVYTLNLWPVLEGVLWRCDDAQRMTEIFSSTRFICI